MTKINNKAVFLLFVATLSFVGSGFSMKGRGYEEDTKREILERIMREVIEAQDKLIERAEERKKRRDEYRSKLQETLNGFLDGSKTEAVIEEETWLGPIKNEYKCTEEVVVRHRVGLFEVYIKEEPLEKEAKKKRGKQFQEELCCLCRDDDSPAKIIPCCGQMCFSCLESILTPGEAESAGTARPKFNEKIGLYLSDYPQIKIRGKKYAEIGNCWWRWKDFGYLYIQKPTCSFCRKPFPKNWYIKEGEWLEKEEIINHAKREMIICVLRKKLDKEKVFQKALREERARFECGAIVDAIFSSVCKRIKLEEEQQQNKNERDQS